MGEIKQVCPRFHQAIELVGKRWTGAIIQTLMAGPRRYSSLLEAIPGLHDRLLSERLKELEAEGIVTRRVYPDTPVRVEYGLSEKGRDLERVLVEMDQWADRWAAGTANGQRKVILGPYLG
jgi:DNA-binding HxlR family transcriptional regulator